MVTISIITSCLQGRRVLEAQAEEQSMKKYQDQVPTLGASQAIANFRHMTCDFKIDSLLVMNR
jgi:hypothetical protein